MKYQLSFWFILMRSILNQCTTVAKRLGAWSLFLHLSVTSYFFEKVNKISINRKKEIKYFYSDLQEWTKKNRSRKFSRFIYSRSKFCHEKCFWLKFNSGKAVNLVNDYQESEWEWQLTYSIFSIDKLTFYLIFWNNLINLNTSDQMMSL